MKVLRDPDGIEELAFDVRVVDFRFSGFPIQLLGNSRQGQDLVAGGP